MLLGGTQRQSVVLAVGAVTFSILLLYAIYTMYYNTKLVLPFCLSVISGLSTCIGALIVISTSTPITDTHLAYTCGLAAGVMLYISIFDMLLPAVFSSLTNKVNTAALFVAGNVFLCVVVQLLPDDNLIEMISPAGTDRVTIKRVDVAASGTEYDIESNTLIPISTASISPRANRTPKQSHSAPSLTVSNGSSTTDLVTTHNTRTLRFGLITAIVLAIHNLPEGLSVFISALDNKQAGLLMAFAISLHNIAEGLVVAVPVYATTRNVMHTVVLTSLSGVTEPIGALLSITLFHNYLTHTAVQYALVFVAGIMFAVSLVELLPEGLRYRQNKHFTAGIVSGVLIMATAVYMAEL